MTHCMLRPRTSEDDLDIVAIINQQEGDGHLITVEEYRSGLAEAVEAGRGERWAAVQDDRVAGVGALDHAWWTGDPNIYCAEIRVDRDQRRLGVGSALWDLLLKRARQRRAKRLLAWVRADAPEGRRFAARRGFTETGQVIEEYRLRLAEANTSAYDGAERRLRGEGVRIATLAELGPASQPFLHQLHLLWSGTGEEPLDPQVLASSFDSWRERVIEGIDSSLTWVALEGERPAGLTILKRLGPRDAENDFTVVAPDRRGRGIAQALKRRAIDWARRNGAEALHTSSEIGNVRMIAINRRLGYRPGVRRIEVARDL